MHYLKWLVQHYFLFNNTFLHLFYWFGVQTWFKGQNLSKFNSIHKKVIFNVGNSFKKGDNQTYN